MSDPLSKLQPLYTKFYQNRNFKLADKLRGNRTNLNVLLFFATIGTTFLTGWLQDGRWQSGAWYCVGIISILLAHEMGHYLMCRKYGIQATLPFFIPFPPFISPFGTLGALIKMESAVPSRKALFDVAVAGPLAGLVFTVPAIYYGVKFSAVIEKTNMEAGKTVYYLGESLAYKFISFIAIGSLPDTHDVMMHPLAYAGWAGLFVTALNLLPIGQLDGGHVIYALFKRHHAIISFVATLIFAVVAVIFFWGYLPFAALLMWFGLKHPPTLDETKVDKRRKIIGVITIIIFFLSFTLVPFKLVEI